tara:strand:+ start:208 stop:1092 length:885 start_codon:yes stop_codon:yes gene_type:complete
MEDKYKIMIYALLGIIFIYVIYLILNYTYSEKYNDNIYNSFKRSLNYINKKVRKGVFTYYTPDKKIIDWVLTILKDYNCEVYIHPKIYYGHPDLEFDYSHTMGDYIMLSNSDYNLLKRYYNDDNDNVIYSVGLTIIHESLHVHQRFNYEKYKRLYKMWGYVFVPKIYNFNHILKTKRQNPDANDNDVLWYSGGKYYFINCFFDKDNPDSSVTRLAYPIIKDSRNNYKYNNETPIFLNRLSNYHNFFGQVHNNYTPNEICAEYNEKLYMDCVNQQMTFNSPAYEIFKNWYKTNVF